jgi:LPS-assembly lipoprotein
MQKIYKNLSAIAVNIGNNLNLSAIKTLIAMLLTALLCLSISGCGFTVRPQTNFPPQLKTIYLQTADMYGPFEVELQREFQDAGVSVAATPSQAAIIMHLLPTAFSYSTETTGPSTQARIFHLTMTTTFSLTSKTSTVILAPQTVTATRDLTLGANEIFEISTLVDVTKQSMRKDLVRKVFDRLSSRNTFEAVSGKKQNIQKKPVAKAHENSRATTR